MTNIKALFLQSATRGQCQIIVPACKQRWAWFMERLCLHYDLIFLVNHIFILVKYALSTQHATEKAEWQSVKPSVMVMALPQVLSLIYASHFIIHAATTL